MNGSRSHLIPFTFYDSIKDPNRKRAHVDATWGTKGSGRAGKKVIVSVPINEI